MKNRGFTLIELLAVISIIVVIALISYPVVTDLIDQSEKNAFESSVTELANVAELDYTEFYRTGDVTYTLGSDKLTCPVCTEGVKFSGNIEGGKGTLVVNKGKVTSINISNTSFQAKLVGGKIVVTSL